MNKYKIYERDGKQMIERLVFPRFRAEITFSSPISDIENIELIDNCNDVMTAAMAMRETGDYLLEFSRPKD